VGDTHLGVKNGSPLYHKVTEDLFDQIIEFSKQKSIRSLIHLGDFFDNRKTITIKTILSALHIMNKINDVFDAYFIVGNHDTINKDSIDESLLSMFRKFENMTIIDRPLKLPNILMVPWLFDTSVLKNTDNSKILLGHFEMNGVMMNESGSVMESAHLNRGDFKNFELVLSGHFHTPSIYGNIRYLGSPFHTSFNDVAGKRGFYVLDDETCELTFIEYDKYPKYIRIKDTDNPEDVAGSVPNNIVELIFTKDHGITGNLEIVERVKSWSPLTLIPKYVNINGSMSKDSMIKEDIEIKDHLGILHEYHDQNELPGHINPIMLNKIVESIYKETLDGQKNQM